MLEYEATLESVENFIVPENYRVIEVTYDKRFKNRYLSGKTYEFVKDIFYESYEKIT